MHHAVLLVDDDDRVLACLVRALRKQPYQIYTARNGEEAVSILKTRTIDVVVTRPADARNVRRRTARLDDRPLPERDADRAHRLRRNRHRAPHHQRMGRLPFLTKPCNGAHLGDRRPKDAGTKRAAR